MAVFRPRSFKAFVGGRARTASISLNVVGLERQVRAMNNVFSSGPVVAKLMGKLSADLVELTGEELTNATTTDTGNLRANWFVQKSSPSRAYNAWAYNKSVSPEQAKGISMGRFTSLRASVRPNQEWFWSNNAPHFVTVDTGGFPVRSGDFPPARAAARQMKIREREARGTDGQTHVGGYTQHAPKGITIEAVQNIRSKRDALLKNFRRTVGLVMSKKP